MIRRIDMCASPDDWIALCESVGLAADVMSVVISHSKKRATEVVELRATSLKRC